MRALGEGDGFRIALQEALAFTGSEGFDGLLGDTAGGHVAHLVRFFAHLPCVIAKLSIDPMDAVVPGVNERLRSQKMPRLNGEDFAVLRECAEGMGSALERRDVQAYLQHTTAST
ncbi:hypothetical protein D3C80_1328720 [compost metagenome]